MTKSATGTGPSTKPEKQSLKLNPKKKKAGDYIGDNALLGDTDWGRSSCFLGHAAIEKQIERNPEEECDIQVTAHT